MAHIELGPNQERVLIALRDRPGDYLTAGEIIVSSGLNHAQVYNACVGLMGRDLVERRPHTMDPKVAPNWLWRAA